MNPIQLIWALISGALFGFGLSLSTMTHPEVVLSFLRFTDFGLLMVLGGAVIVATLCYQHAPRLLAKPLFGPVWGKYPSN